VSRWRSYRRYCSRVRAGFVLRLRPGCEGLLTVTITGCTECMEFIVSK
jgi:hypothetical protein